jgi:hypothetical protein
MATAGLFNMGGADVEALQRQMDEQRANEFAKMSNTEKLSNLAYTSTAGAGRALLGAFGADATDPALKATLTKNRIASEIDYNDHASVKEGINKLAQAGFVEEARQLATALDVSVKTRAEAAAKTSEKLTPEQKNAAGLADAAGLQRGTAEWTKAYSDALKGLTNKNEPTAVVETADGVFLVNKVTGERISRVGGAPQRGTRVDVQVKQDEAVTKSNVEAFGKLRDSGIQAGQTIEAVKTIKPLIDQSFAGFASDSKLTAGQLAEAFGIPIKGTSETEQLRSLQNNLKIGNSTVLKGALSDKDMAILGEAIGQGSVTKAGLKSIMNNIEKDALISQKQYQKANEYQQQGKLSQYDFVRGSEESRAEVNAKLKRLTELERKARGQ